MDRFHSVEFIVVNSPDHVHSVDDTYNLQIIARELQCVVPQTQRDSLYSCNCRRTNCILQKVMSVVDQKRKKLLKYFIENPFYINIMNKVFFNIR